jgi:hypothetical protein
MSNSPISEVATVKPATARRWLLACLVAAVMIPSIGHAQLTTADATPTTLMAIESGWHWVGKDALTVATVSDGDTSTAFATVRLELRDLTGRVVAGTTAQLGRGTPAQLRFQNTTLKQLSLFVKITGFRDSGHAPVTIWEDISPAGSITLGGSCGLMGGGGGGQHMCIGFRLTAEQPDPWQP